MGNVEDGHSTLEKHLQQVALWREVNDLAIAYSVCLSYFFLTKTAIIILYLLGLA